MSILAPAYDQPSTWDEMLAAMRERYQNTSGERLGQAYFNALRIAWPEIAELVRGTAADPFYADSFEAPSMKKFFEIVIPYFVSK